MTVHASKELLEAMLGQSPRGPDASGTMRWRFGRRAICGANTLLADERTVEATPVTGSGEHPEDVNVADCPNCLRRLRASLPEEALMRLDTIEARDGK